jgi:iron complex transport system ATP-binding protein
MGRARYVRLFGGLAPADIRAVDMALDHVGIVDLAQRSFLELSGGERQLVLIARALAAECEALLGSLARRRALSIIFSAHPPDHVFAVADAVIILTRGEVLVYGPVNTVLTTKRLSHIYGVPVEILEMPQAGSTRRYAVPLL